MISFCYDDLGEYGIGYPNLAPPGLQPWQFDTTWPRAVPMRLLLYLQHLGIDAQACLVEHCRKHSWYPVALAWFDHDLDYFELMSATVIERLQQKHCRVLFYYHEGDNPHVIKHRLDQLCLQHGLDSDCYLFVSANTAADHVPGFRWLSDHEFFFRYLNRLQQASAPDDGRRPYQFVALNRTHKWWRATCMADLERSSVLRHSLWSYNTECDIGDDPRDNPIMIDSIAGLRDSVHRFMQQGSRWCDAAAPDQHNDHRQVNESLYKDAYCHIILETLFDADGSQGTFLTEKTYKALKFGQPFVMVAPPRSLDRLRQQGYHVFDDVMDNSYDLITDNTQRWLAIKALLQQLQQSDMQQWFRGCLPDVMHNQQHFLDCGHEHIRDFVKVLTCPHQ